GAKFMKRADFPSSTFLKNVDFTRVTFLGNVDFSGATFSGDITFMNTTFRGDVDLSDAKFQGRVIFSNVTFSGSTNFLNTEFSGTVEFSRTTFLASTIFSNVKFLNNVIFSNNNFQADTTFSGTRFLKNVDFSNTIFLKYVDFSRSILLGYTTFFRTSFLSDTNFSDTRFSKDVEFVETVFSGHTDFSNVVFSDLVNFSHTVFLGRTEFNYTRFLKDAIFRETEFQPGFPLLELSVDKYILFRNAYFENQKNVIFDNVDMSKVSFIDTDITRIKFRNVKWEEYDNRYILYCEKLLILKNDGYYRYRHIVRALNRLKRLRSNEEELRKRIEELYKLSDERLSEKIHEIIEEIDHALKKSVKEWDRELLERIESQSIDEILSMYRALRENYEYYLRYETAGKFFISEMEMMKCSRRGIERAVLTLYKCLCLYGESCTRPIIWSVLIIVLFALVRLCLQLFSLPSTISLSDKTSVIAMFIENLEISVATFFQMYTVLEYHVLIERLLSVIILGCLFISLRRRFEKKVRTR
ncbi:MAG: hypothetical protein DRJ49_05405, partial [Thermoprotei archaeon]